MRLEDLEKSPEKTFDYIHQRLARMGRFPAMRLVHRAFEVKDSGDHRYLGHTYIQIGKNIYLRWIVGRIERPIFYQMGHHICDFRPLKFIIDELAYPDRDWQAYAYADSQEMLFIKAGLHPNVDKLRFAMEKDLAIQSAFTEKSIEKSRRKFNKVFGHLNKANQPSTPPAEFSCSSSHVFQNTQQLVKQLADKLNTLNPHVTLEQGNVFARVACSEVELHESLETGRYLWCFVTHNNVSVPFGLFVDSHYKRLFIVPACLEEGDFQRDGNKPYQRYHIKSAGFTDER